MAGRGGVQRPKRLLRQDQIRLKTHLRQPTAFEGEIEESKGDPLADYRTRHSKTAVLKQRKQHDDAMRALYNFSLSSAISQRVSQRVERGHRGESRERY